MMEGSIALLTATDVTAAIRSGHISAYEVVEAQLSRIAKHNPALTAIVTLDTEGARRCAREADEALERGEVPGVLHGLPVTIKDFFEVAGMRSTCSHPPLANNVPERDAVAVARLRAAGAVIMGKTNMPELAMDFQTVSPLFGRTNNPWDLKRTPGGSTGGGAAAIAAGLSFLELGSDLAGSLRIPAHYCGVFGLAPTYNLVPKTGSLPGRPSGGTMSQFLRVGLLARSVADLQLGLSVIAGPDTTDPEVVPVPSRTVPAFALADMRIGWTDDVGLPVAADVRDAMAAFVDGLAARGCYVDRASPSGFDFSAANRLHSHILFTAIGARMPTAARMAGRYLGKIDAFDLNLKRYLKVEDQRFELTVALEQFLSQWDAWLCPVTAAPAFEHLEPVRYAGPTPIYGPIQVDGQAVDYTTASAGFTRPLNVTGNPVVTMPIGTSTEGLPIGIQVVGRRWDDWRLLSVAAQLAGVARPLRLRLAA